MKKLNELFDCDYDVDIKGIKINSKEIEPGDLFVCTKGATVDRHDFIEDAISKGAVAAVVSKPVDVSIPTVKVDNPNKILGSLCQRFYDYPDKRLHMIGVTGTDGKTSVSTITQTLIGKDLCGYIGTNGYGCAKFDKKTNNTTPDADKLYGYLQEFIDCGCEYTAMESSSEAIYFGRIKEIKYDVTAITNITSEHLNTHGTLENYIACKKELFTQVKDGGYCVLNKDDEHYEEVRSACKGKVVTYGLSEDNTLRIKNFTLSPKNTEITLTYENKDYTFISPLLGDFNVYNLSCAILIGLSLGFTMEYLISNVKNINVSGRLDMIDLGQDYSVMVDYAHTPNGISSILNFVNTLNINRSIVVIGQAGERDPYKREIVGEVVANNATYAIFTYEDPRSEDPNKIIEMMTKRIKHKDNYEIVIDRSEAIKKAIDLAEPNDMVLILGKGNENYEKLKDRVIHFNDEEEAIKYIKARKECEKTYKLKPIKK